MIIKIKSTTNLIFKSKAIIKTLLLLAFSGTSIGLLAQTSIQGRISDEQQNLPFATVLLLGMDSVMVKGVVTDAAGAFIFEHVVPGDYLISASMVGYTTFYSQPFTTSDEQFIVPEIILEESATELTEVVVKSEKQLFEQKIDRLVVNVQSSITSSGNTILEVLQKSPGIVVNRQNNSITMNGKPGVRIMINDKAMQLPLDIVVQMLDGMNASDVDKIELITTPPAEYDAEGNAGIIHIVTKKDFDLGTKGSVGLTLGARWAETLGANFNLNHRNKNFAYFVDYSVLRNHNLHTVKMDRSSQHGEFTQTTHDYSRRENVTTQQNVSAGLEWKISKKTTLNLLFTGYSRDWQLNAHTDDTNHAARDSTVITGMQISETNNWKSATGSIGIQTKINAKSDFSISMDYLYYHNNNPSHYENSVFYEQQNINEVSEIDLKKTTPIHFYIIKTDYRYQVSPSFTWEAGLKGVTSTLDNNVFVQRGAGDVWTVDPVFTSYSTLQEQVAAAYVSTQWQPGKRWQFNSGLRYEYTHTSIHTPAQINLVKRRYGYLFPSFSAKKSLGMEKDFQFSYSKRITRPTYNDIAPYVFFWSPNTFSSGNTSLYPAIADAISVGYHVKQWIVSLQFSHARKEIIFLQPEVDSQSNNVTYRSQNLKYLNTLGLTNSYSISITPWWEVQSNLTAQYQVAKTSHLPNNTTLQLYGVNLNVVNLIKLPKDFSIEISGMYQSKSLAGISQFLPMGSLNAGIQKTFGEKGTLRFSMDDILYTSSWRIKTDAPEVNLNTYFYYDWHNQFIRLTYTRNLGNNKLRSVKVKSASEEERGRVGN